MSGQFSGKRALITGGARRLGREIGLALARRGTDIAVHYNTSEAPANALCRELETEGIRAFPVGGNLSQEAAVDSLFETAWETLGRIDFLINNASIFPPGRLDQLRFPELLSNIQVNAWAPFLLTRALERRLRKAGAQGSVVNLLDTRLVGADLAHSAYHLSKSMLAELTTMMALEFAPLLQINGVAPGAVLPPEELDETYLESLTASLPLKRRGYPSDIAEAVVYLLSSSFVTGQVLFVDGGRHIRMGGNT